MTEFGLSILPGDLGHDGKPLIMVEGEENGDLRIEDVYLPLPTSSTVLPQNASE